MQASQTIKCKGFQSGVFEKGRRASLSFSDVSLFYNHPNVKSMLIQLGHVVKVTVFEVEEDDIGAI